MSKVVSMRLKDEQFERLSRVARKFSKKPSETAAQLLEEAMRREEFPFVDIRGTTAGREAFVGGSRLRVYHVAIRAREGESAAEIAESLGFLESQISGAIAYAERYADEMDATIAEGEAAFDRLFPDARKDRVTQVHASAS
jgi:uncharacterized protein (DUF433 family)